ncbi:MAG: IS701 family transposase [Christensenellaceae bacterium]|jgi:SRSO17 transposase|nr:IS701 family transposase [Christensenellaceae bacterium]
MLLDQTPINGHVKDFLPITLRIANKTELEPLWDKSIRNYHYLGFGKMIGQSIKYIAWAADKPVAALSYNRASLRVGVRDTFIGWSEEGRRRFLDNIICNHRFLIFPWVNVKNLASCVLAKSLHSIRIDWQEAYGSEPKLVETFIDSERYNGTCYLAANFKYLGETKGYGKYGKKFKYHGGKKKVFLFILDHKFIKSIAPHLQRTVRPKISENSEQMVGLKMILSIPDWEQNLLKEIGIIPSGLHKLSEMLFDYLCGYTDCFTHIAQIPLFFLYIKGLMSDLERKSIEPIALKYGKTDATIRSLQLFLKSSPWKDEQMHELYQMQLSDIVSENDGMLTVDSSEFPKKGNDSAGVARQHCGRLGKTDNCQSGVFVGYSGSKGYGLISASLYLPEQWVSEEFTQKRKQCGIPEDIVFKTKNEIAIENINSIYNRGLFKVKWISADAAFGHDRKFVDAIPKDLYYFLDVHASDKFFPEMPKKTAASMKQMGKKHLRDQHNMKAMQVRDIVENDDTPWQEVVLSIGAKGHITGYEILIRVFDVRDDLPNERIFLYARKHNDGSVKHTISNAPDTTPIEKFRELALRRWPIEQCFEECKSCLGMDQYELRSWNGWHRHMLLIFVAHLFLQIVRNKYTADITDLSEHVQKLHEILHEHDDDCQTKAVVLTTRVARNIVHAASEKSKSCIKNIFRRTNHIMRSYAKAFLSCCKKCKPKILSLFRREKKSVKTDTSSQSFINKLWKVMKTI